MSRLMEAKPPEACLLPRFVRPPIDDRRLKGRLGSNAEDQRLVARVRGR